MFGENKEEYSSKQKTKIPVWHSPKYEASKKKALEIISTFPNINEGDFWILMNETKTGKMAYTGLIISHNACLKINDTLTDGFHPESVQCDVSGYGSTLVFSYVNAEQGIYEVGEVSKENCKNAYPYAMALKRCFDRVVLKLSKIAYEGIYSDSEADEFAGKNEEAPVAPDKNNHYECSKCGKKVQGTRTRTADEMKQACIERFGKPYCPDCAAGIAKEEKEISNE